MVKSASRLPGVPLVHNRAGAISTHTAPQPPYPSMDAPVPREALRVYRLEHQSNTPEDPAVTDSNELMSPFVIRASEAMLV